MLLLFEKPDAEKFAIFSSIDDILFVGVRWIKALTNQVEAPQYDCLLFSKVIVEDLKEEQGVFDLHR